MARNAVGRPDHLVLTGPTASGKSAVALELARLLGDVEIVSVDSMQVYRGMDIGTAKPTVEEQREVPHHLIDLVDPDEDYAVAEFQAAAQRVLAEIESRGHRALLVGGTGLYLRAVVDDLDIPGRYPEILSDLEGEPDTEVLHRRLLEADPDAAGRMEPTNRRRVLRALEVTLGSGRRFSSFGPGLEQFPRVAFVQRALAIPRASIDARIEQRYARQMADGFLDEVVALAGRPEGLSRTAGQALGYRELLAHVAGTCSLQEALDSAALRTRQFARRQERWFRRDPRIRWVEAPSDGGFHNHMATVAALLEDFAVGMATTP